MVTLRPPNRLALPGSTSIVVTPAAWASGSCGACGQIEGSAQSCAVLGAGAQPGAATRMQQAAAAPRASEREVTVASWSALRELEGDRGALDLELHHHGIVLGHVERHRLIEPGELHLPAGDAARRHRH